jgi:hypothetical protein
LDRKDLVLLEEQKNENLEHQLLEKGSDNERLKAALNDMLSSSREKILVLERTALAGLEVRFPHGW